jgi:hypothetical protein
MCEGWDLSRGFSGKGARNKIGSKGYGVLHGVFTKPSSPSFYSVRGQGRLPAGGSGGHWHRLSGRREARQSTGKGRGGRDETLGVLTSAGGGP